jgi:hypothetical protein
MLLGSACLLASATFGTAAVARSKGDDSTCHVKSYAALIGESITETRNLGNNYRLIVAGTNPGPVQPERLTFVYDAASDRIVNVMCG